jgi:hypothetical protein
LDEIDGLRTNALINIKIGTAVTAISDALSIGVLV